MPENYEDYPEEFDEDYPVADNAPQSVPARAAGGKAGGVPRSAKNAKMPATVSKVPMTIREMLERPLAEENISYVGSRQDPYLPVGVVNSTLNEIFGFDGWSEEVIDLSYHGDPTYPGSVHVTLNLKLDFDGKMVQHVGRGVGTLRGYDNAFAAAEAGNRQKYFEALETAEGAAMADALKKAAKKLGVQFGLTIKDTAQGSSQSPQQGGGYSNYGGGGNSGGNYGGGGGGGGGRAQVAAVAPFDLTKDGITKGTPFSEISEEGLQKYVFLIGRSIEDPSKANFLDKNKATLAAIQSELESRG